ncbi:hypothetical protein [Nocardia rhizosphaerae]|uniref:Uncharacterized protein n=1 Tax=Nocardia rhizosphaerae TaxID=1691571 RepID=A0ABV8L293_9NOCA
MTAKRAPVRAVKNQKPERVTESWVTTIRDVEITLPSLSYLKPGLMRKIRGRSELDQFFMLLEMHLNEEQLAAIDDLDPDEFAEFTDSWREHSGVSLGES